MRASLSQVSPLVSFEGEGLGVRPLPGDLMQTPSYLETPMYGSFFGYDLFQN